MDNSHYKVGTGAIIQDWEGAVLGTLRMKRDLYPDPFLAKSVAALQTIIFYQSLGIKIKLLRA